MQDRKLCVRLSFSAFVAERNSRGQLEKFMAAGQKSNLSIGDNARDEWPRQGENK